MNNHFYSAMRIFSALIIIIFFTFSLSAQTPVNDSVSTGPGYAKQTFYSLSTGTVSSIDNSDWELAFNEDNREVGIFINARKGVTLYLASKDTSKWNTLDTTNKTATPYHNSDSSWSYGAFNCDITGGFDYGWGVYSATTHELYASRIFFINYGTTWKKIMIVKHDVNYVYTFRYANLDGTNEVTATIDKANTAYKGKNFIYYSLVNNTILNREPLMINYDLIAHQHEEEIGPGMHYLVTGIQSGRGVKTAKVYPVNDVNTITPAGQVLTTDISTIGYDWKAYDVGAMKYTISDSTVYFVQDSKGANIWKLIFTGFGGGGNGTMYFTKTAYASGINTKAVIALGLYPNPSKGSSTLNFYTHTQAPVSILVKDMTGREVMTLNTQSTDGFNGVNIDTRNLTNGTYIIRVQTGEGSASQKLIVNN